jgi:hypothetical protein
VNRIVPCDSVGKCEVLAFLLADERCVASRRCACRRAGFIGDPDIFFFRVDSGTCWRHIHMRQWEMHEFWSWPARHVLTRFVGVKMRRRFHLPGSVTLPMLVLLPSGVTVPLISYGNRRAHGSSVRAHGIWATLSWQPMSYMLLHTLRRFWQ